MSLEKLTFTPAPAMIKPSSFPKKLASTKGLRQNRDAFCKLLDGSHSKFRDYPEEFALLPKVPISDDQIQILQNPEVFKKELLELIDSVEQRIYMTVLYIENDEAGQEVLEHLIKVKADNPAVDIQLIMDFYRNQRGRKGENGGNPILEKFHQINEGKSGDEKINVLGVPIEVQESKGVMHTKGMVFDDTLLYSGASINNVYLDNNGKYRLDRYWKIDNGNLADTFVDYAVRTFIDALSMRRLDNGKIRRDRELKGDIRNQRKNLIWNQYSNDAFLDYSSGQMYAVPIAGYESGSLLNKVFVDMVASAEDNVTIYSPYFNISHEMRNALAYVLNKGVNIDIIVADKMANDFHRTPSEIANFLASKPSNLDRFQLCGLDAVPYFYEQQLRQFAKQFDQYIADKQLNIHLWQDGCNTYHAKGITVDNGKLAMNTGHNGNERSEEADIENGLLLVNSSEVVQKMLEDEKHNIMSHTQRLAEYTGLPDKTSYSKRTKTGLRILKMLETVYAG